MANSTQRLSVGSRSSPTAPSLPALLELAQNPQIAGFTTNPTLMRKAGVKDYRAFAREALAHIVKKPISFEVFADDFAEMNRQARAIAAWGDNVYVKIPITNTKGESAVPLVRELTAAGVKLNVTALCTLGPGARDGAGARGRGAVGDLGVRGPHRRHGPRPGAADARGAGDLRRRRPQHRAAVGQPARAAEHDPGGRGRLPHHHGDATTCSRSWS